MSDFDALKAEIRSAISNAYYDSRDEGQTMEVAADRAAEAALHRVLRSDAGAWVTVDSLAAALPASVMAVDSRIAGDGSYEEVVLSRDELAAAIIQAAKEAEQPPKDFGFQVVLPPAKEAERE